MGYIIGETISLGQAINDTALADVLVEVQEAYQSREVINPATVLGTVIHFIDQDLRTLRFKVLIPGSANDGETMSTSEVVYQCDTPLGEEIGFEAVNIPKHLFSGLPIEQIIMSSAYNAGLTQGVIS